MGAGLGGRVQVGVITDAAGPQHVGVGRMRPDLPDQAEVGARFALDAMPGKQLAIDADLAAGAITHAEAKARRERESQETTFFGSLDGASKFVKGDAVAALLILGVNVIGGLIIGVGEKLSEVYLGPLVGGGIEIWFAYMLALVFLLFRPQGLFGEKIIDRV